jgi:hypothetical protein
MIWNTSIGYRIEFRSSASVGRVIGPSAALKGGAPVRRSLPQT